MLENYALLALLHGSINNIYVYIFLFILISYYESCPFSICVLIEGDLSVEDITNLWFLLPTIAAAEHIKCQKQNKRKKTSFINCLTVNFEVGASFYVCQRKERQQAVGTWQLPTGAVFFMAWAVLPSCWWLQGQFFMSQPYFFFCIRPG